MMESTSTQGIDLDESDEHEDVSKNMGLCMVDVDKITEQQPNESLVLVSESAEPYAGMEFNSRDAARDFYVAYGRRNGFTVRTHHNRRSRINNMVIGQDFVCSKEGFREKKYVYRKDRVLPPPPVTREGCAAMLRLALRDGDKWVVTKFIREHNHPLMSPSKLPWRASSKSLITEDEKDQRIRQLTQELNSEKQRSKRLCAAYQEQLHAVLKFVEEHTDYLSTKVQDIVKNVRELEDDSDCRYV